MTNFVFLSIDGHGDRDELNLHTETAADPKRMRILQGAMEVFLAYGFQRTTMDDIARAAEVSRPALYLLFRNKTDIYRALASDFLAATLDHVREALASERPLAERLASSIDCAMHMVDEVEKSPHGAEIMDMKNSLAGDIIASGRATMGELVEKAIDEEIARRGTDLAAKGLSARILADMLLDALDGMKMRGSPRDAQQRSAASFVRVVEAILAD